MVTCSARKGYSHSNSRSACSFDLHTVTSKPPTHGILFAASARILLQGRGNHQGRALFAMPYMPRHMQSASKDHLQVYHVLPNSYKLFFLFSALVLTFFCSCPTAPHTLIWVQPTACPFKVKMRQHACKCFIEFVLHVGQSSVFWQGQASVCTVNAVVQHLCQRAVSVLTELVFVRRHIFCDRCLTEWLRRETTCPLCRKVIRLAHAQDVREDGTTPVLPIVF
jgi:hypothetical protein